MVQSALRLIESWLSWLLPSFGLAVLGVSLVIVGLWRTRRGTTPFCRKCGYNLTGLDLAAARCPECGGLLRQRGAILMGERRVSRWKLGVGLVAFSAGASWGTWKGIPAARSVDWYQFKPAGWVIDDWRGSNPALWVKAEKELARRLQGGLLADGHVRRLVGIGLAEQRRPKVSRMNSPIALLGKLHKRGDMTEKERRQFFEHLLLIHAKARPTVVPGDFVTVEFHYEWRGPFQPERDGIELTCDPGPWGRMETSNTIIAACRRKSGAYPWTLRFLELGGGNGPVHAQDGLFCTKP